MSDVDSTIPANAKRRRWRKRIMIFLAVLFVGFLLLNVVAFMQARAMTHFVSPGMRTPPPEELNLFGKVKVLLTGVRIPRPENLVDPSVIGLDFQTVRFGGAGGDDCEGWVISARNPKGLVILFNPYSSSKSALIQPAGAFHELGYDCLLVDFRGSGGSHGSETSCGYREAEDVVSAVQYANHSLPNQSVILYGPSMGGAAVLRAVAQLRVNPKAIILESTFDSLLETAKNRFSAMHIPSFPNAQLLVFWGGVQEGFNGFSLNPAEYARDVRCPVLLFQGGRDPRVSNGQAQNIFDHLAGPKQMETFPSSGHCAFLADDPTRWKAIVSAFLLVR